MHVYHASQIDSVYCRSFENLSRARGAGAHCGPKEAPSAGACPDHETKKEKEKSRAAVLLSISSALGRVVPAGRGIRARSAGQARKRPMG